MKVVLAYDCLKSSRGGPFFLINQLKDYLLKNNLSCEIVEYGRFPFHNLIINLSKIYSCNIVHLFGAWNFFHILIFFFSKILKKKIIITPLGFFEPWSLNQKKIKKKIALNLYQIFFLRNADLILCASNQEKKNLKKLSQSLKIKTLAHGISGQFLLKKSNVLKKKFSKKAVFVSRIHKKKGINELIQSWIEINNADWSLDIIGSKDDISLFNKIKEKTKKMKNIKLLNPIYNEKIKKSVWSQYDLFLLPTYSENFGMVILEFLSVGVPVLTTSNTPWKIIEKSNAGWIVKNNKEALTKKLRNIFNLKSSDFKKKSINALNLANLYKWENLIKKQIIIYNNLIKFN